MTEPVRLIDETQSEFERALLRAGVECPSDGMRQARVLAAIGVGATIAVTSKTSVAAALTWKKAVAGVALAATGVGGVVTYQAITPRAEMVMPAQQPQERLANQERLAEARQQAVDVAEAPEPVDEESVLPVVELDVAEFEDLAEDPPSGSVTRTPRVARAKRAAKPQAVAPTASDLQEEVAYLDQARAALRAGRPSSTLSQLGEYRSKFPRGSLGQEAELLRIEALSASGQKNGSIATSGTFAGA